MAGMNSQSIERPDQKIIGQLNLTTVFKNKLLIKKLATSDNRIDPSVYFQ